MKLALSALLLLVAVPAGWLGGAMPYACNRSAMTKAERVVHEKTSRILLSSVLEQEELTNGFAFRLPPGRFAMAAQWVALERKCCPFFTFEMELVGDEGPLWLRITGGEGVKAFIRGEFGLGGD